MRLTSIITITTAVSAVTASAHPGEPGHTHGPEEWPFPDIKWAAIALGALALAVALGALRARLRKNLARP